MSSPPCIAPCPFCNGVDPANGSHFHHLQLPPWGSGFNGLILVLSSPRQTLNPQFGERAFNLYYNPGAGSGIMQLPHSMSELLFGPRFDNVLHTLSRVGFSVWARSETQAASRQAIDALPTLEIDVESECAVCIETLTLGSEALEMPCRHFFHADCIVPWLNEHNSCPVCREKLPGDLPGRPDTEGFEILRFPSGEFAVARLFEGGDTEFLGIIRKVGGRLTVNACNGMTVVFGGPLMRRRRGGALRRFIENLGSVFSCASGGATTVRQE